MRGEEVLKKTSKENQQQEKVKGNLCKWKVYSKNIDGDERGEERRQGERRDIERREENDEKK